MILDEDRSIASESRGTRLGAGLGDGGSLDPVARERTLAAVSDYVVQARGYGARVQCIATSAMRRAADAEGFARDVASLVGSAPRILSGDEEATFSFLGATASRDDAEYVGVLDVGGGSTEIAVDRPARARAARFVARTRSLEIGAVRLSERHPKLLGADALDAPEAKALLIDARTDAAAILAPLANIGNIQRLIAVGGTAFTAAAMIARAPLSNGITISGADRLSLLDVLLACDLEARRRLPFIRPQRADILPAGIVIVDEACKRLGVDVCEVSEDDLLAGYLRFA